MSEAKYLPAIVVAAYNRTQSLQRLLRSLEEAVYPQEPITLIISIDKGTPEVAALAEKFPWKHGEKKIIRQDSHLGLKAHILQCGDLTAEYGSIILFEDDLFASKYFYDYALKSLNQYGDDERIAGISLYSYDIAENGFNPFVPVDDGADVYFMQVASSWGQAWTEKQWKTFRAWFEKNPEMTQEEMCPAYLSTWRENSWKKHFVRYLHFNNKFFVFPRHSFTTNFEEPGGTAFTKGLYQVPLVEGSRTYNFSGLDESKSVYDASFEMTAACLKKWCLFLKEYDFTVDLYGTLPISNCKTSYLLTVKDAKQKALGFSLEMFPPVLNVINNIQGEQVKLVKKENVLSEKVSADTAYYKFTPVSEIIFQEELVERVEKVFAKYRVQIDDLHKTYTGKMEALNDEIRKLNKSHYQKINQLHDEYAMKLKSAADVALKDYQFKLDYPQFTIVTLVNRENIESALATARSVMKQDYPRISHNIIIIGSADGLNLTEFETTEKCSFRNFGTIKEALDAAAALFNHNESDYHCWLEAGTALLPKALLTVKSLFKRFAEVNWLKGIPIKAGGKGELLPAVHSVDFRWDDIRYYNSSLQSLNNQFSRGGIFWKRHVWDNAGGKFNPSFPHLADIEFWNRLFAKEQLHVVFANLAAANADYVPSAEALKEFGALQSSFPKRSAWQQAASSAFFPFFKRDIPVLRALHKWQHRYPPLIRFDYNSQSFYLSEY